MKLRFVGVGAVLFKLMRYTNIPFRLLVNLTFLVLEFAFAVSVSCSQIFEKLNSHVGDNFWRFKSIISLCFVVALILSVLSAVYENTSKSVILSAFEDQVFKSCIAVPFKSYQAIRLLNNLRV